MNKLGVVKVRAFEANEPLKQSDDNTQSQCNFLLLFFFKQGKLIRKKREEEEKQREKNRLIKCV